MNVGDVGHFQDFFYSPEKSFYKKVLDFAYTAYTNGYDLKFYIYYIVEAENEPRDTNHQD